MLVSGHADGPALIIGPWTRTLGTEVSDKGCLGPFRRGRVAVSKRAAGGGLTRGGRRAYQLNGGARSVQLRRGRGRWAARQKEVSIAPQRLGAPPNPLCPAAVERPLDRNKNGAAPASPAARGAISFVPERRVSLDGSRVNCLNPLTVRGQCRMTNWELRVARAPSGRAFRNSSYDILHSSLGQP
jgi:hypothetical protein